MLIWIRILSVALLAGAALGCATTGARNEAMSFAAMGDGPRAPEEWPVFAQQVITESDDPRSAFLIHLGDITRGTDELPEWHYRGVAGLLRESDIPVYIVLGDNEWNDLLNPDIGWKHWNKYFLGFNKQFRDAPRTVYQAKRPENFAFVKDGVLIVGINIVGGRVHEPAEWKRRHADNLEWVADCFARFDAKVRAAVVCGQARPSDEKHGDFFPTFVEEVKAFGKPVLYLHGDGHTYQVESPWRAPNLVRVQVDSVVKNPPLLVTVTTDPKAPFTFDRRIPQ